MYDSEYLEVRNVEDYFRYYVSQKSIGLSLTYAGFTLSAAFSRTKGEIQAFLKNNTRITSTINNVALMFQLSLLERYTESNLERRFNDAVRNLPLEYDATAYKYGSSSCHISPILSTRLLILVFCVSCSGAF